VGHPSSGEYSYINKPYFNDDAFFKRSKYIEFILIVDCRDDDGDGAT
jgi:hypothetical protein